MEITVWIDKFSRPSFKVGTLCLYPFIVPPCDHFVAVSNIKKVHVGTLLKSGPSLFGFGAVQQFNSFVTSRFVPRRSHSRLCDALIVLKGLVVMELPLVPLVVLLPLQHGQKALKRVTRLKIISQCGVNSNPFLSDRAYKREQRANLVNANVLLFSLNHPDTFLAHLVDDPEDVDHIVFADALQNPV